MLWKWIWWSWELDKYYIVKHHYTKQYLNIFTCILYNFYMYNKPVLSSHSTSSKQRKNVISCVTVHDSPDSDSSNTSPYAVESRPNGPNANSYDSKGAVLDNYSNGNPRTIIIPPLKSQTSENLGECDRLLPGETGEGLIRWQRKRDIWQGLNQASI